LVTHRMGVQCETERRLRSESGGGPAQDDPSLKVHRSAGFSRFPRVLHYNFQMTDPDSAASAAGEWVLREDGLSGPIAGNGQKTA